MWEETFGGAAEGAKVGAAVGGPWGAAIGAGVGALAGFTAGKSKQRGIRRARRAIRAKYREQFRVMHNQFEATVGTQRAGYAAANVVANVGTARRLTDETSFEYAKAWRLAQDAQKAELQGTRVQSNFWAAGLSALQAGGSIYGAKQKQDNKGT